VTAPELSQLNVSGRLGPDAFRGLARAKGYTLAELARTWGLSPARLTQIAADLARPAHYDLALWGTPARRQAAAVAAKRAEHVAALRGVPSRRQSRRRAEDFDPAQHWRDATRLSAQFVADAEQGDHIPEGCVAEVVGTSGQGDGQLVTLRFSTGYTEDFTLGYLKSPDCFLWPRGLLSTEGPPAS